MKKLSLTLFALLVGLLALGRTGGVQQVAAQQPTGSVPTVTGTPTGAIVRVTYPEQINVRGGPSTYFYPIVGVLLPGQEVEVVGRSPGGEWLQIRYPGVPGNVAWVHAPLVTFVVNGTIPIVEPPPTATPVTTPTIDPTLAAAFIVPATPTRLPTFTPPPPLVVPTFTEAVSSGGGVPRGLLIFALGFVGALSGLISLLQGRG